MLWAALAVAVFGVVMWAVTSGGGPKQEVVADATRGAERNVWGQATAPVTVIEYGDYQ